jgi:hypothetical protein
VYEDGLLNLPTVMRLDAAEATQAAHQAPARTVYVKADALSEPCSAFGSKLHSIVALDRARNSRLFTFPFCDQMQSRLP